MNGQIYQICRIAAEAKRAVKDQSEIVYTPLSYENKIEFRFLQEKKLFRAKPYTADNVASWYAHCLKKRVRDIHVFMPTAVHDRNILGFSNTTQSSVVCYYDQRVTYFSPQWDFDSEQKMWNVLYTEQEWTEAPLEKPRFENNSTNFITVLSKIKELAHAIDCDNFAAVFQKAIAILSGSSDEYDAVYSMPVPKLPQQNRRLFAAAGTADVFGAMGSWNDSPSYMAHEKGLDTEYAAVSDELLKQIRLALLYAVNEW